MKITSLLLLFFLLPTLATAEQSYIEVTAPGNRALQLAVAPPTPLAGSGDTKIAGDLAELFRFDMTLAGPFAVQEARVAEGKSGIRPGDFDFAALEIIRCRPSPEDRLFHLRHHSYPGMQAL